MGRLYGVKQYRRSLLGAVGRMKESLKWRAQGHFPTQTHAKTGLSVKHKLRYLFETGSDSFHHDDEARL